METNWTTERIEELSNKIKKHIAEKSYAERIAEDIKHLHSLCDVIRESYYNGTSYEEQEVLWKEQTRAETAIMMKIKHFFNMVYSKGNSFCNNLKGKDYLEHYFTFKDFVENPIYNIRLA